MERSESEAGRDGETAAQPQHKCCRSLAVAPAGNGSTSLVGVTRVMAAQVQVLSPLSPSHPCLMTLITTTNRLGRRQDSKTYQDDKASRRQGINTSRHRLALRRRRGRRRVSEDTKEPFTVFHAFQKASLCLVLHFRDKTLSEDANPCLAHALIHLLVGAHISTLTRGSKGLEGPCAVNDRVRRRTASRYTLGCQYCIGLQ